MIQIIMQRLCCGETRHKKMYRPLFTLGSLAGDALKRKIEERLRHIFNEAPANHSYYHNVWSEAHMPAYMALVNGTATSMKDVYAQQLQPERQNLRDLKVVEAGPMRFRELIATALSQKPDCKGDRLVSTKLIEKCCFGAVTGQAESVRYIRAQFTKAFQNKSDSFAALVAACLYLGTLPNAPMASPDTRIAFHTDTTGHIERMLTVLPSRTLWVSLIYAITSMCDTDPIFARMRKLYFGLYVTERRADVDERQQTVICKAIPALQGVLQLDGSRCRKRVRSRDVVSVESALGSVAQQKRRLTETCVLSLFPGEPNSERAKQKLAPIYRAILRSAPWHTKPCSALLKQLNIDSPVGKAIYSHAIEQRREFSLIPRNGTLQKNCGRTAPHVKMCLDCYSLRSGIRHSPPNKATDGTIMQRSGKEMCAACRGENCVSFCPTRFVVSSLNKHTDAKCVVGQVCSGCGFLSVIDKIVGIHPYCSSCAKELKPTVKLRCGVCEKVLSKRSYYMHVIHTNRTGHATEAAVCANCQTLGPSTTPEAWDLDALRELQAGRRQQFGIIFRKSIRRKGIIAGRKM